MDRYVDLRPLERVTKELTKLWWLYLLQALALIALGVAVLVWPQLVVALVAGFLIAAGFVVLLIAWRVWSAKREYERLVREFLEPAGTFPR